MKVVVDANVLVALSVSVSYSQAASARLKIWLEGGVALFAPSFWSYEAVSAIRKFVAKGELTQEQALGAVSRLLSLGVREVEPSWELHQKALDWAQRLDHFVAYDGAYLAVAEHLEAAFWTADRPLVEKARELDVDWIHLIGEHPT